MPNTQNKYNAFCKHDPKMSHIVCTNRAAQLYKCLKCGATLRNLNGVMVIAYQPPNVGYGNYNK